MKILKPNLVLHTLQIQSLTLVCTHMQTPNLVLVCIYT